MGSPVQPASPGVISTASFWSNTFNYDPLFASETISQSAPIAPSLGVLKRGQVLSGWAAGGARTGNLSLTGAACAILAQDIDTGAGGAVTGLVYTQGKFLDTSLIWGTGGPAAQYPQLWQNGIYTLTVEQRSGILVPMTGLPAGSGPMPQALGPKEAKAQTQKEVDAIKAALEAWKPGSAGVPIAGSSAASKDPAWATAAFGERPETKTGQAQDQAAEKSEELQAKQQQELDELLQKQREELSELGKKQMQETQKAQQDAQKQLQQAQQADEKAAQQQPAQQHQADNPGQHEHRPPPPKSSR
ncbi:MAG TPA: hypothetical protein VGF16_16585 [Bryobacteraceae bacterium]|jgi:hypothetical protein